MVLTDEEYEIFKQLVEILHQHHPGISKEYTYRTNVSILLGVKIPSLKNTLFKKNRPNMSRTIFTKFCKVSTGYLEDKSIYTTWRDRLLIRFTEFEKNVNRSKSKRSKQSTGSLNNSQKVFWDYIRSIFNQSSWHCYERYGDHITKSIFKFGVLQKETWSVNIELPDKKLRNNEGVAKYAWGNNALEITSNDPISKDNYAQFVFKININTKQVEVSIGHKTYIEKSEDGIGSSRVLLVKIPDAGESGDFVTENSILLEKIRSFFYPSEVNVLTTLTTTQSLDISRKLLGSRRAKGRKKISGYKTVVSYSISFPSENYIKLY